MPDVPPEAVAVLNTFLDASRRKDLAAMTACLSRRTLEGGQPHEGPEGMRFALGETHMEGPLAVIDIKGFPDDAPADAEPVMQMSCLLVQEEGKWKFDLNGTMERMMGPQIEAAMQQVAEGMDQAMGKIGQAVATALGGGEQSSNYDPSWEQASLTPEEDELFALADMPSLPKTTLRVTYAVGKDVPVQLAIGDAISHLPPEQRDDMLNQVINWFDNVLFAQWQPIFTEVIDAGVPLENRLRMVRIEEAKQCEDRILILDGSALVYRMNPTNSEGYFTDEFLSAALPGILAGLPEKINSVVTGNRLLPLDGERPTVESYRERWVPRWMRRICTLLGKPIGFEMDWDRAADANNTGPELPRWGLNRVYGALALACLDSSRKEKLKRDLKTIEIEVGSSVVKRSAKYEDGKLTVGLSYYGGDTPGCYEHEIAAALAGNPVK